MSRLKLKKWDVVEHLQTDEDAVCFFNACIEEDPGDGSVIRSTLGSIARAKGMSQLARDAGLTRETLSKDLSEDGNPEFGTILQVIRALGFRLRVEVAA